MIQTVIVTEQQAFHLYGTSRPSDGRIAGIAMDNAGHGDSTLIDYTIRRLAREAAYEVELNIRTEAERKLIENDDFVISKKEAQMLFKYLSAHGCEWEDSDAWLDLYGRLKQCVT